ncbi:complement C3-like [Rhinophrynus dorsalis]
MATFQCTLITPNVLHVESEETIVVDAQYQNSPFDANVIIQDFPLKSFSLVQSTVSLNHNNNFLGIAKLTIPSKDLLKDPKKKQFVYVTVRSSLCSLEKVVLVSFHSGYIFVQTDKTIYTPGSKVNYRIFSMNYKLQPVSKAMVIEFLTPEGIIVKREMVIQSSKSGIFSRTYPIPEFVNTGIWTISATYKDSPQQNYTNHFEVKEYVLPSFEVTLKPDKSFFYIEDKEFIVKLQAMYVYGKPVNGSAFVIFSLQKEGERVSLTHTLSREEIVNGNGKARLKREDLLKAIPNTQEWLKYTMHLSVTVITSSGTDMVQAELDNIYIVNSPYKILFTKTSKYFKPGLSMDLMVLVTNPDGSPAEKVKVVAQPGNMGGITQEDGTARLNINTPSSETPLEITVKTQQAGLSEKLQASASMTATPYSTPKDYLHINIAASVLKPGSNVAVSFYTRSKVSGEEIDFPYFTYLIINKGRIMSVGRQPRDRGQTLVTMSIPLTEEFIPSFRIVAYYLVKSSEVWEMVSDSVWVDVVDSCMGTLKVTGAQPSDNKIQKPTSPMTLKLMADHRAFVGLVAVDKAVYILNNKFKMSQSKIWDTVEKNDIGCTPGGGANSMGVFYDAGLAVHTSFKMTTAERSVPLCEVHSKRKRRSSGLMIDIKTTKASAYKDLEKKCCQDGMQENPMGHNCERRSLLIQEKQSCKDAFLDCCRYIEKKRKEEKELKEEDDLSRSEKDDDYIASADIVSRTMFPESWLWSIEEMKEIPESGISTKLLNIHLKDSITTWEVQAVSLSETKGICVAQPYEIQVLKDFFIDLKLPYSVVRNEQVEIRAILYNYGNIQIKVRVELMHNPEFCSASTIKKNFRLEVYIGPTSSTVVPFIIVPLNLGETEVEVKASVYQMFVSDGVKKTLNVVPEGMRATHILKSVTLEPEVKGKGGIQKETVSALNVKNIVPRTEISTFVTVQGTPISEMVKDAIDGAKLDPLIIMPSGCSEQNIKGMTLVVIATHYLDSTNQWEQVGLQRRQQALENIEKGYTTELTFRKDDNSYPPYRKTESSTWLTAYISKVFAMASSLVNIDQNVLCGAIKWLILKNQKPDGLFQESSPVSDQYMTNLQFSIDRATQYVLNQYSSLRNPHSIAIASYALAKAGKLKDTTKLMSVATDNTRWVADGSHLGSFEATSYALLTLLHMKQFHLIDPIARWLIEQRFYGAYGSTQATIMMFQALTEYQRTKPPLNQLSLDVSIYLPEKGEDKTIRITADNAMEARSEKTNINKDFVVTAKGKGQGTLTVMSVYYAIVTEQETECKNFYLNVTAPKRPEGAVSTVSLTICTRHLKSVDATMSILDVSMMTGFTPDIDSLNKLKNSVDKYIADFEINKDAYDKGTLIIYLKKISHREEECIKFNVHQFFKVGLIQPASVTVYDYYTPENRCTKFYHFEEESKLLGRICQGDVCRCAEENCLMQQHVEKEEITVPFRLTKACEPGVDYVFKATVTDIQHRENYDNYVMNIVMVVKEGTDAAPLGQNRNFISHKKCRHLLDLKIGRDYLIWGVTSDLWNQPSGYSYIIGRETWIEWWPKLTECQDEQHQKICNEFSHLSEILDLTGCPN